MNCYISDLYLFHESSIRFDSRPFKSMEEMHSVLAWLPIEKTEIDIKELWWNPEYRLISIIYDSIMVFAKDADDYLTMEYYSGDKGMG